MARETQEAIYGVYPDTGGATAAVRSLVREGISEISLELLSPEPIEDPSILPGRKKSWMPWLAALGGLVGGIGGMLVVAGTQKAYPLPTGKMPIVSAWANGVVVFELTMLGVVLMTIVVLLLTARLPDWKAQLYDPAVSDGKVLVAVLNPTEEDRPRIEALLQGAGSEVVKKFEPNRKDPP